MKAWTFLEEVLAGVFFTFGILLIFYGVVMRYVMNNPQAWVEEVSRYTIIWGVFLGFGLALKHNQHIQVDILFDKLNNTGKFIINLVATGLSIVFCLIYTYYGFVLHGHAGHARLDAAARGKPVKCARVEDK